MTPSLHEAGKPKPLTPEEREYYKARGEVWDAAAPERAARKATEFAQLSLARRVRSKTAKGTGGLLLVLLMILVALVIVGLVALLVAFVIFSAGIIVKLAGSVLIVVVASLVWREVTGKNDPPA